MSACVILQNFNFKVHLFYVIFVLLFDFVAISLNTCKGTLENKKKLTFSFFVRLLNFLQYLCMRLQPKGGVGLCLSRIGLRIFPP